MTLKRTKKYTKNCSKKYYEVQFLKKLLKITFVSIAGNNAFETFFGF